MRLRDRLGNYAHDNQQPMNEQALPTLGQPVAVADAGALSTDSHPADGITPPWPSQAAGTSAPAATGQPHTADSPAPAAYPAASVPQQASNRPWPGSASPQGQYPPPVSTPVTSDAVSGPGSSTTDPAQPARWQAEAASHSSPLAPPHPTTSTGNNGAVPSGIATPTTSVSKAGQRSLPRTSEQYQQLKRSAMLELGAEPSFADLGDGAFRQQASRMIAQHVRSHLPSFDETQLQQVTIDIIDDIVGLGPVEELLRDREISEVMINGGGSVYVERAGLLQEDHSIALTEPDVYRIIERIVARVGRRIDEAQPMVDARLADGSRVNAVIPPIAIDGPSVTIRRFLDHVLGLDDLVSLGSLTADAAAFLAMCVAGKRNVLVSGGTGSGKTTLLNALSAYIDDEERIITIEDAAELQLRHRHLIRLESRPAGPGGVGQISVRDLLRNSLRMRPDRIIIGEVRDGSALDLLQAMSTGHDGSLGTLHASGVRDALRRLETMVLMSGLDVPVRAVRDQIGAGVDLVVHVQRTASGKREVAAIAEVVGHTGEAITVQSLFEIQQGDLVPTGFEPSFWPQISHLAPRFMPPGVVQ